MRSYDCSSVTIDEKKRLEDIQIEILEIELGITKMNSKLELLETERSDIMDKYIKSDAKLIEDLLERLRKGRA